MSTLPDDTDKHVMFPELDDEIPEEIPTTPELQVQIRKNVECSSRTISRATDILRALEHRSSNPPKE